MCSSKYLSKRMKYFILLSLFTVAFSSRSQTSGSLIGGWRDASPTSESVRRVAERALNKLSENGESEIVEVCEAKTQLVSGVNYDVSMIIKTKDSQDDLTNRHCKVKAYEIPWQNFFEIEEAICDKSQKRCIKK